VIISSRSEPPKSSKMSVSELRLDLSELRGLFVQSTRPAVKALLEAEVKRVEAEIKKVEASKPVPTASTAAADKPAAAAARTGPVPTVKISNYGWDESDKFVKLYITLSGVEKAAKEEIECEFKHNSFSLWAMVGGKRHELAMKDLVGEIDVDASSCKQKTDMLVVMCKKKETGGKKWGYLTKTEKNEKEKNAPKMPSAGDEPKDPNESLMGLMKQMYDDGDDEMKRTIRKAWHEGQSKKGAGGGLEGMMGM
ncbi:hypothetical protein PFISCL1PPCAC_3711, partial [Pristionchus fissidentatus]